MNGTLLNKYEYDNDGNVSKETDYQGNVTTKFDYNDTNQVVRTEVYRGDSTKSDDFESRKQYTYYDLWGKPIGISVVDVCCNPTDPWARGGLADTIHDSTKVMDKVSDVAKLTKKSGAEASEFFQDVNGRWHRANGQFASKAEVGISSPAKTPKGSHGNSLSDPRTNYGYALVDKDTNEILKFGETIHPKTRYSKKYLDANNADMMILEQGSKEYIHYWQYDMNKYYQYMYEEFPPLLNSKGW